MASYSNYTDQELVSQVKSGDHAAFTEIYNRYWDTLYLHSLRMLGDDEEAKDLLQDLFTALWLKAPGLDVQTNLSGYLYSMLRHKVLNAIRNNKYRETFHSGLARFIDTQGNQTLDQLNEKEMAAALDQEIARLPEKMRHIFELSRKEYLSHKEIASKLNISDSTVKKQISNAIKTIKPNIDKLGTITAALIAWWR